MGRGFVFRFVLVEVCFGRRTCYWSIFFRCGIAVLVSRKFGSCVWSVVCL